MVQTIGSKDFSPIAAKSASNNSMFLDKLDMVIKQKDNNGKISTLTGSWQLIKTVILSKKFPVFDDIPKYKCYKLFFKNISTKEGEGKMSLEINNIKASQYKSIISNEGKTYQDSYNAFIIANVSSSVSVSGELILDGVSGQGYGGCISGSLTSIKNLSPFIFLGGIMTINTDVIKSINIFADDINLDIGSIELYGKN